MKEKDISEMCAKERKEFLSNDLIERMIRVEQRVSASFREHIPYNKTSYYKSLTPHQQQNFEKYLKRKKRRKFLIPIAFAVPFILFFVLRTDFTGRAIDSSVGEGSSFIFGMVVLAFILIFASVLIMSFLSNKKKEEMFKDHVSILEKAMRISNKKKSISFLGLSQS